MPTFFLANANANGGWTCSSLSAAVDLGDFTTQLPERKIKSSRSSYEHKPLFKPRFHFGTGRETLHWKHPGTVWAIDHSQPPRLVDGCYPVVLAVRNLASGMQLAWTPVPDAKAPAAIEVLEHFVRSHGAPLVLKSDNGSAFVADEFRTWLDRQQVVHLCSPVRMPRFNGACEAGIGAAKRRTDYLAARHDRHLDWSASDLSAAQEWANEFSYPGGLAAETLASRFAARHVFDQISRDTFQCAIVQYEYQYNHNDCTAGDALTDTLLAVHRRRAIRQALVELGYLDITRKSVPQPLHVAKCARISVTGTSFTERIGKIMTEPALWPKSFGRIAQGSSESLPTPFIAATNFPSG